jgi:trehalose/maltose hydrolase-like predicted phosphorylase
MMPSWSLVYDTFEPEQEPLRESLTTLGNGCFATRGACEWARADGVHYPGTYVAGGYNRLPSVVGDRTIFNEDLVNWPNWLPLTFRAEGGDWFTLQAVEVLAYQHALHMHDGVLERRLHVRDNAGRESLIETRRFVHMGPPHYGAIAFALTAKNWSGRVDVKSALDGSVMNAGVPRYQDLNAKHLHVINTGGLDDERMFLHVETNQSYRRMAQVARHQFYQNHKLIELKPTCTRESESVTYQYALAMEQGRTLHIEKIVAVYCSHDKAIRECLDDAVIASQEAGRFHALLKTHHQAWQRLWHRCDVELDSAHDEQKVLRLHAFHLLQTLSPHVIALDAGAPARGLHGEAYRGHVFWDELFIFPFYFYRLPDVTRALLLYRYHRLPMARLAAKKAGFQGAMFPWQSASNGEEETQTVHLNPRSGTWGDDLSRYQRHVNAAIVYNLWQYLQMTDDDAFFDAYAAEMMLDIARFLASLTKLNAKTARYEIHHVVGPDEYHEQYPGSSEAGINNNAYTNVMTVWVLERALEVLSTLRPGRRVELMAQLGITEDETQVWKAITKQMVIFFHDDAGVISQFEGYEALQAFDWEGYTKKYGNIERLDRVLKAEGDTPNKYQVSKQADVVMLFYLFSEAELIRMFHQLGYNHVDKACLSNTIAYYQARTSHGSTLSKVVFASVLASGEAGLDDAHAQHYFKEALNSDIHDTQGGTTAEGIHLGVMAGTVDLVMRHAAGITMDNKGLHVNPCLPSHINGLCFRIQHKGVWYHLDIKHTSVCVTLEHDEPRKLGVYGHEVRLLAGEKQEFIRS